MDEPLQRIVVDSTIWIAWFRPRRTFGHRRHLARLVADERVAIVPVVIAELLAGARSPEERAVYLEMERGGATLEVERGHWIEAGDLRAARRASGQTIGLADCLIAAVARSAGLPVWTEDQDFGPLFDEGYVTRYVPPEPDQVTPS